MFYHVEFFLIVKQIQSWNKNIEFVLIVAFHNVSTVS